MAVPAVQPSRLRSFQLRRLAAGVASGVALQLVLLALGLHASLWFAGVTSSYRVYWALCGAYMTAGLAMGLLIIPWHRLAIRFTVFFSLICISFLTAMFFNWSKPAT